MALEPAITNTASPRQIDQAFGPNVWSFRDLNTTNPRFVMQIWSWYSQASPSPELLFDLRQQSNPAGYAHFDVGRVLQNQVAPQTALSQTAWTWLNNTNHNTNEIPGEAYQDFAYTVKWGYENPAGLPVIQGESEPHMVFAGRKPFYETQWEISPFRPQFDPVNPASGQITLYQRARPLTQMWDAYNEVTDPQRTWPVLHVPVTSTQTAWLPLLIQGEDRYSPDNVVKKRTPFATITVYDEDYNIVIPPSDYRPTFLPQCDEAEENDSLINHEMVPVLDMSLDYVWSQVPGAKYVYVDTGVYYQDLNFGECIKAGGDKNVYGAYKFELSADECNDYEQVTLTWHNYWGFQDFFTFQKERTETRQYQREEYLQQPGSWSSSSFTIDPMQQGTRVFAQSYEDQWTLRTRWLTQKEAEWMRSITDSGYVAIWNGSSQRTPTTPCVVVNTQYTERNERRQKLYQFEITIKFSNNSQLLRG